MIERGLADAGAQLPRGGDERDQEGRRVAILGAEAQPECGPLALGQGAGQAI